MYRAIYTPIYSETDPYAKYIPEAFKRAANTWVEVLPGQGFIFNETDDEYNPYTEFEVLFRGEGTQPWSVFRGELSQFEEIAGPTCEQIIAQFAWGNYLCGDVADYYVKSDAENPDTRNIHFFCRDHVGAKVAAH